MLTYFRTNQPGIFNPVIDKADQLLSTIIPPQRYKVEVAKLYRFSWARTLGSYNTETAQIHLYPRESAPRMLSALVHEYGHYLDMSKAVLDEEVSDDHFDFYMRLRGQNCEEESIEAYRWCPIDCASGLAASHNLGPLSGWWDAVKQSKGVQKVIDGFHKAENPISWRKPIFWYYLAPPELFARSVQQFFLDSRAEVWQELKGFLGYWSPEDFAPVRAALERELPVLASLPTS